MSLAEAQISVIGYLAAQGIPAYGAASNACKESACSVPTSSRRVEALRGVLSTAIRTSLK
jgi:hypothetical protein